MGSPENSGCGGALMKGWDMSVSVKVESSESFGVGEMDVRCYHGCSILT